MKKAIKLLVVAALFAACSSDDDSTIKEIKLNETETEIAANSPAFAVNLLKAVDGTFENNDKYVVSPLSASLALSMAMNGANGETYDQIADAMSLGDYSLDEINDYNKKIVDGITRLDKQAKMSIANSVWLNEGFYPLETFSQRIIKYYGAKSEMLDFSNENAVGVINNWVSNETNGLITQLYEQLNDDTPFVLADAFYFKCPWHDKFDAKNTKVDKFYAYDGTVQKVEFMVGDNKGTVGKTYCRQEYSFCTIFLGKNNAFAMDFVMPIGEKSLDECLALLDNGALSKIYNNQADDHYSSYKNELCRFILPKLNIEVNAALNDALVRMGIEDAFNPEEADFGQLSQSSTYVSEVRQANVFSIDEGGAEAAASTGIKGRFTYNPPYNIVINRPFLFFVRENKTNTILYAGKVNKI
ncbi:MAG: hypothetical protein IKZ37_05970 [Bacteroidaceae bacterium]|nr:hypothetical protein [Bacteroidaceae bacterium]